MAQVGVSITKKTAFRDSTQEFANTYHYEYAGLNPSASLAESIIDAIVAIEKAIHASSVTFTYARCWSSGGTIAENQMIFEKALSGTGATIPNTSMDKERAILIQWGAGKDSRNRTVRLKKWFHVCGSIGGIGFSADNLANTISFSTGQRTQIADACAGLHPLTVNAISMNLCAESGRAIDGSISAHKFLEHHQLGDQWRN